ncbi:hypothetical protein TRVL_02001 [Trypanosoma vivax]|nr:hypothetical protein TRVL_02001 [Trypanosoma vivax]
MVSAAVWERTSRAERQRAAQPFRRTRSAEQPTPATTVVSGGRSEDGAGAVNRNVVLINVLQRHELDVAMMRTTYGRDASPRREGRVGHAAKQRDRAREI